MFINVSEVSRIVSNRIVATVDANWTDYAENFDEDALIQGELQEMIDPQLSFYDDLLIKVSNSPEVRTALSYCKQQVKELAAEAWATMTNEDRKHFSYAQQADLL